jgi:CheY-like chemotaxis protein
MGKLAQVLRSGIFPRTQTILIVEPDPVLRHLEKNALSRQYKIVQTSSPEEAVRRAARHRADLDLLLTTVRFPHMDGWELTELLKLDYPKLKAIYVSTSIDTSKARPYPCTVIVLEKDGFSADLLLQTVHDTLEAPTQNQRTVRDKTDSLFSFHRWAKPPI